MLVSRSLEYYRNYNMRVIIVDNSTISSNFSLKKKEMYFHLPKKDFIYRIIYGIKKSSTKYVAVCQDDDFLNVSALNSGIRFLNKNKDFSFVNGVDIYFEKKIFNFILTYVYEKKSYNKKTSKDLFKRFKEIRNSKTQMTASLFRKNDILKSLISFKKLKLNKNIKLKFYDELAFSNFAILHGRYKHLNKIWQIRDRSVYPYTKRNNNTSISRPISTISNKEFLSLKETKKLKFFFYKFIKKKYKKFIDYESFERHFDYPVIRNKSINNFNKIKFHIKKYIYPVFLLLKITNKFIYLINSRNISFEKSSNKLFFSKEWPIIKKILIKYETEVKKISLS